MAPIGHIYQGRLGRWFVANETSFNATPPSITGSNALRHLDGEITFDPAKYTDAPDRFRDASLRRRIAHEAVAGFNLKTLQAWPSGTIGTKPEADLLLLNAFGAQHLPALTTTIASGASATGAVLTSGAGLQVGDWALINVTGDKRRAVRLATVAGATVTWNQTLPTVPTVGDTFKSGVTYSLAAELPGSLYMAHYLVQNGSTLSREATGCVVDEWTFLVEQAKEPNFSFKGPAAFQTRPATNAEPGSFTTIGSALPTGMIAYLYVGTNTTPYPTKKVTVTLKNNEVLRMGEIGHDRGTDYFREKPRACKVQIEAYVEDPTQLYAIGEGKTTVALWLQIGTVEGQIWAVQIPNASVDLPSTGDQDGPITWNFTAECLASSVGLDEISLGAL